MEISTILKIVVAFLSFVISGFLIRHEFKRASAHGKLLGFEKAYVFVLGLIMVATSIYTVIDGYDAIKSQRMIESLQAGISEITVDLNLAKNEHNDLLKRLNDADTKLDNANAKLDEFKPFIDLAVKRFGDKDTSSALQMLYGELESLKKNVKQVSIQFDYRQLSGDLRKKVVDNLKNCNLCRDVLFEIGDAAGRPANRQISRDLAKILESAGLNVQLNDMTLMQGAYIPPPIETNVNPASLDLEKQFIEAIGPIFSNFRPKLRMKNSMGTKRLRFLIYGTPKFDESGRISFE